MIPIRNIYYMLAYAFQVLHEQGYKDVAAEDVRNTAELLDAKACLFRLSGAYADST